MPTKRQSKKIDEIRAAAKQAAAKRAARKKGGAATNAVHDTTKKRTCKTRPEIRKELPIYEDAHAASGPDEQKIATARVLGSLGATDLEVSQAFNVTTRTIYRWKVENAAFREALEAGKGLADERVKDSLLKRATGYTYDAEKVMVVNGQLMRVPVVEHLPPDTRACLAWLRSRDPENWNEKRSPADAPDADGGVDNFLKSLGGTSFRPVEEPEEEGLAGQASFRVVEDDEDLADV